MLILCLRLAPAINFLIFDSRVEFQIDYFQSHFEQIVRKLKRMKIVLFELFLLYLV
jgi:hypothetical protein